MKNGVWEVVSKPEGNSTITSKWIYKIKHVVDGIIRNHKSRFVSWGLSQKEYIDYDEAFTLLARYTIRAMISRECVLGLNIH